jgi:hypothetical protein
MARIAVAISWALSVCIGGRRYQRLQGCSCMKETIVRFMTGI